jgi:hypothetical protein
VESIVGVLCIRGSVAAAAESRWMGTNVPPPYGVQLCGLAWKVEPKGGAERWSEKQVEARVTRLDLVSI